MSIPRGKGFTLIEVLISLSLLGLILTGMFSALTAVGDSGERLEAHSLQSDQVRITASFLRQTLGSAQNLAYREGGEQNYIPHFQGKRAELVWVGLMPARHGLGGLSYFRLAPHSNPEGMTLAVQVVPYDPQLAQPDWQQAEAHELLSSLDSLALRYRSPGKDEWFDSWSNVYTVPGLVELSIVSAGRPMPLLLIAPSEARPEPNQ